MAILCDLTDRSQVSHMVQQVMTNFGRIDILVNNAGIIATGPLQSLSIEDFEMSMNNIYWTTFNTTMAVLPQMIER